MTEKSFQKCWLLSFLSRGSVSIWNELFATCSYLKCCSTQFEKLVIFYIWLLLQRSIIFLWRIHLENCVALTKCDTVTVGYFIALSFELNLIQSETLVGYITLRCNRLKRRYHCLDLLYLAYSYYSHSSFLEMELLWRYRNAWMSYMIVIWQWNQIWLILKASSAANWFLDNY